MRLRAGRGRGTSGVRGLVLDIDGVLTVSWQPLPGAAEAMARLRRAEMPFRLLTNTTELTRRDVVERLGSAGMEVSPGEVVTAMVATGEFVRAEYPEARCLLIGGSDPTEDLAGITIVGPAEPTEVVIVGGASEAIPWDIANRALRLALDGVPVVAMHGSLTWMTDQGLVMDMGVALANALARAGARVRVVGKPSLEIFVEAVGMLGVPARDAAMVGDDLATDVLAARRVGMRGILVRTGKFRPEELDRTEEEPDAVIDSVAELPDLLGLD